MTTELVGEELLDLGEHLINQDAFAAISPVKIMVARRGSSPRNADDRNAARRLCVGVVVPHE